jgi:hypothetical protein
MDDDPHKAPQQRRWLRFSLRTLFVLVTLVAIWAAYSAHWIRQRREFVRKLESDSWPFTVAEFNSAIFAPGLLGLFGEDGVETITLAIEPDMAEARRLFPEAQIEYLPPP